MRVGVALGEVVIADSTVTGPGIALAQRLEQLAEPGGICVQGSIYEAVPQRLPYEFTNLGEHILKGFKEPVRAFSAALMPSAMLPAPESQVAARPSSNRLPMRAIAAVLVVAMALSAWWWFTRLPLEPANEAAAANVFPDKPSIAVLPFVNMSDGPRQSYFSDGLTGDIITDLARVSGLLVIARSSTFVYKGQAPDVTELGRKLGVRYVVEGSVQRSGTRLRISARLVDAQSGLQVWANRYDR